MKINWFPGHMKKTLDLLSKEVSSVDGILYILDSRAPISSLNPSFLRIIKRKPVIYVLNKIDMGDRNKINKIRDAFKTREMITIEFNSLNKINRSAILDVIKLAVNKENKKNKDIEIEKIVKLLVVGIPNTGKSTFINRLSGKYSAITGNKPGVTKNKQWVKVDKNIRILDTPGTLSPHSNNQTFLNRLSAIGSIKDNIVNIEEVIFNFLGDMLDDYTSQLQNRYSINIDDNDSTIEVYNKIAISKGCFLKGTKEIDYQKTAQIILNDFRNMRICKITLDTAKDLEIYD